MEGKGFGNENIRLQKIRTENTNTKMDGRKEEKNEGGYDDDANRSVRKDRERRQGHWGVVGQVGHHATLTCFISLVSNQRRIPGSL